MSELQLITKFCKFCDQPFQTNCKRKKYCCKSHAHVNWYYKKGRILLGHLSWVERRKVKAGFGK